MILEKFARRSYLSLEEKGMGEGKGGSGELIKDFSP